MIGKSSEYHLDQPDPLAEHQTTTVAQPSIPMLSQKTLAITLLSLNTILLFADQNLMAPNLSAMAAEFGFTDEERDRKLGGDIAVAFFLLGAPVSLVIGCLADVVQNRTRLFALTIFLGEGGCLATYWVKTYAQLYVCRAVTGISVGGALPLIFSILGDMFPADKRHAASGFVGIGTGVGIFLGQGAAGFLGPSFGWRLPFLVVSAPALVTGFAFWLLVDDPERGCMEEANIRPSGPYVFEETKSESDGDDADWSSSQDGVDHTKKKESTLSWLVTALRLQLRSFCTLLSTPTMILCLFQGAPGCVPWGVMNVFLADFLANDRGMTVAWATVVLLASGIGSFFGILVGGIFGSYLYRRDKRFPALLAGLSTALGCVPFWALLNLSEASLNSNSWLPYLLAGSLGFCASITGPIVKATLQNATLPETRGQAFALMNTFDDFGRGLGPVFVSLLIQGLGGRLRAFNVAAGFWMACALLNFLIFFTIRTDQENVQRIIEQKRCEHVTSSLIPTGMSQMDDEQKVR